jgi:hypothetical protein
LTWKKYASSERLEELDSEQNRLSNFRKATLFDSYRLAIFAVSELEIVSSKQAKDGSVKIKYQNRSFPDTNGEAVLLKEDNLWKINSDSLFPALE